METLNRAATRTTNNARRSFIAAVRAHAHEQISSVRATLLARKIVNATADLLKLKILRESMRTNDDQLDIASMAAMNADAEIAYYESRLLGLKTRMGQ